MYIILQAANIKIQDCYYEFENHFNSLVFCGVKHESEKGIPHPVNYYMAFYVYYNIAYNFNIDGPTVDETMNVTILSSRDKAQVDFSLTFDVTFGPQSRIDCSYDNERFYKEIRDDDDQLSREVIRSQYSSSQPDITRVIVTVGQPIRKSRT